MEISDDVAAIQMNSLAISGSKVTRRRKGGALSDRTNSSRSRQISSSSQKNKRKQASTTTERSLHSTSIPSAKNRSIMNVDTYTKSNVRTMTSVLLPSREAKSTFPEDQVQWVGMTPLDWIESLKAKTMGPSAMEVSTAETDAEKGFSPLGQNKNSSTTPTKSTFSSSVVPKTPFSTPSSDKLESSTTTPMEMDTGCTTTTSFLANMKSTPTAPTTMMNMDFVKDQKQEAPDSSMSSSPRSWANHVRSPESPFRPPVVGGNQVFSPPTVTTASPNSAQMPLYWDFSYLQRTPLTERLRVLVLTVEAHASFPQIRLAYHRTLNHFKYSVWYIRSHDPQAVVQLDRLYHETIHKVEILLDLAQRLATPAVLDVVEYEMAETAETPVVPEVQQAAGTPPSTTPAIKIGNYMSKWLRDNWINPYPDETVLQTLANDCETTPPTIANWLVNARTRRWRPALNQALELNRPADVLLEDSLNIFDGEPIRDLLDGC
jgi:hypothetical protein